MRKVRVLALPFLLSALLVAGSQSAAPTAFAAGGHSVAATSAAKKKGISAWKFDGVTKALADSNSGWFYTWSSGKGGIKPPRGVEFVPMIHDAGSVTNKELGLAEKQGKSLLGFNEPDRSDQAHMSVKQALDLWPRLQSTGLRLGAPAVATGGDVAGGWLDRFMKGAAARHYQVDFIPLHWYGADFDAQRATGQLRSYLEAVHKRYKKPIWLTEYALIDFSSGTPRYPSKAQQAAFVEKSTAMLQHLDYVRRYAWFTLSTDHGDGTGLYHGATANRVGVAYRSAG
ncbi:glycoside hydrolase family protein [Streptomyces sp. SP2-10]|uniref:glycoside hydrolase family protein n=1 Tax=Streptomyces sp. SP2-10 TaxID=2873385 RepID=UPI001CA69D37|nr:glycoside hydrolase family protein [Streptomyces sp. SP2-10]MBY8839934.1 glycoside hydrolase family protein [Streptomyces sp. SP2-10]